MDKLPDKNRTDFSIRTILKVVGVIVAVWVIWKLSVLIWPVLFALIVAIFLAVGINPAVNRIVKWLPSSNRVLGAGIAFLIILTILALIGVLVVPPIFSQIVEFINELPRIFQEDFQTQNNFIANLINNYQLDDEIASWLSNLATSQLAGSEGGLTGVLNAVFGAIVNIVTVLILTFMLLIEGPRIKNQILSLASSKRQRRQWQSMASQMGQVISAYINSQLLIAVIGASVALLFMVILQVPNPLAMAGIIGVLSLIPMIGIIIAAIVVVLSTMLVSFKLALVMIIYFIVYQQIENATLQPYIQSRSLPLSAMMVFIAALTGAYLGGIWGTFLAIPVAGCLRVGIAEFFRNSQHYRRYITNRNQKARSQNDN